MNSKQKPRSPSHNNVCIYSIFLCSAFRDICFSVHHALSCVMCFLLLMSIFYFRWFFWMRKIKKKVNLHVIFQILLYLITVFFKYYCILLYSISIVFYFDFSLLNSSKINNLLTRRDFASMHVFAYLATFMIFVTIIFE